MRVAWVDVGPDVSVLMVDDEEQDVFIGVAGLMDPDGGVMTVVVGMSGGFEEPEGEGGIAGAGSGW